MSKISVYMTCGLNGEISRNGPLIQFKELDTYFRKITTNKSILMGSNTFESCKIPLKGRKVFVLSSKIKTQKDVTIVNSVDEFLELTKTEDEVIICGGSMIYDLTQSLWERAYFNILNMGFQDANKYFNSYISKWNDDTSPTTIHGKNGLYAKCYVLDQNIPETKLTEESA